MSQLTYKRQAWSGCYYASTDTHKFAIDKPDSMWRLRVWVKPPQGRPQSSFIKYDDDIPTMQAAKVIAQQFADIAQQGA